MRPATLPSFSLAAHRPRCPLAAPVLPPLLTTPPIEPWFVQLNPQKHRQAEDRAHRIGQTKPVTAHYLDAKNTFDEAVRTLFEGKLENAEAILDHKLGSAAKCK